MTDKSYFRKIVKRLSDGLEKESIPRFKADKKLKIYESGTDGYMCTMGVLWGLSLYVVVWYDRYTNKDKRRLYYAIFSWKEARLKAVTKRCGKIWGKIRRISGDDQLDDDSYARLEVPFKRSEYGIPLFESYPSLDEPKTNFLGIYEREHVALSQTGMLVRRIQKFIQTVSEDNGNERSYLSDIYSSVENRLLVQSHVRRERDGNLPELRKQEDGYICQACKVDFAKLYGQRWKTCVEAHHSVPLASSNRRVRTTIDDLITLCPNCHKMIHKMQGKVGDINRLIKMVR